MRNLEELREQIDQVDHAMLDLLDQRAALAKEVANVKRSTQKNPVYYRPEREAKIIRERLASYQGELHKQDVAQLFRLIMSSCRALQKQHRIAYLGPQGTFSAMAAKRQFGESEELVALSSIAAVFEAVEKQQADYGVVPIENSTSGVIGETVDLLDKSAVSVIGEILLPVHFNLLSHARKLEEIKRLYMHPQVGLQCKAWLEKHLSSVERVEVPSNAEAARLASLEGGAAALAGLEAAQCYKLPVLSAQVQDDSVNCTRFLVVGRDQVEPSGQDKTALIVTSNDEPGALSKLLQYFADQEVNVSLITSRPRPQAWRYFFYLEVKGHQSDQAVESALQQIAKQTLAMKILGSFPESVG